MKIGRNDPCRCGSGKKYKKCCLDNVKVNPSELAWRRIHSTRNKLTEKILKFTVNNFGKHAIYDAWEEFHEWREVDFNPKSEAMSVFMPWFFYHWYPDIDIDDENENNDENNDKPYIDSDYQDFAPAKLFLTKMSYKLDDLEKRYIKECLCTPFSFFSITSVTPGTGYILQDILREESFNVVEKQGSMNVHKGDILMAKAVTVDGLTTLEASGYFAIPPQYLGEIIKFRNKFKEGPRNICGEFLFEYDIEIIELFHQFEMILFDTAPPQLNNTDNEPIAPHTIIYKIDCPNEVFEKLYDLDLNSTKDELLDDAQFEADNNKIKSIHFCWVKKHTNELLDTDNTILGHMEIKHDTLEIYVNSQNRAEKIKKIIEERLKNTAKHYSTVIESVEKMLENSKQSPSKEPLAGELSQEELMRQPEVIEHLSKLMTKHWENWLTTEIPALDGKTPEQASCSKDGKEILESLILQFERDYDENPQIGMSKEIFSNLRTKLLLN